MFRKFAVSLFGIIFLPLVACQLPGGQAAQPTELPTPVPTAPTTAEPTSTPIEGDFIEFEKVALNDGGASISPYSMKDEVQLLFLTSKDDVALIQDQVSHETLQSLHLIDFDAYLAIALFRGHRPSYNYETVIESILEENGKLIVIAQFWEPGGRSSAEEETYPYHIVRISRSHFSTTLPELVLRTIPIIPTAPAQ